MFQNEVDVLKEELRLKVTRTTVAHCFHFGQCEVDNVYG